MNAKNATMNVCSSRTLGTIVGGVAMLLSIPAYALSLGGFQVESALDEPLKAEIQLNSVDPGTLDSLEVTLGSKDDFQRADVPRSELLQQLKFKVTTKNNQPVVEVTTDKPVKEPFLHFLISAQWSGGKLVREYTGLLDPPLYAAGKPAAVESPGTESSAAAGESTSSSTQASSASGSSMTSESSSGAMATESTASSATTTSGSPGRSAEYGPTQAGDTLWAIASKLDTGSLKVNVFQVMIALLRDNPDAFIDNNINRLKTGQILRLQDLASVAKVTPEEASVAYTAQLEEWQSYKSTVASSGGEVEVPSQEAGVSSENTKTAMASEGTGTSQTTGTQTGAEQAQAQTRNEGQAKGEGGDNVLKIVQATLDDSKKSQAASAGSDQSGEIAELRSQISTLQESLDSKNLENQDLQQRVKLLETQVQNAQRLVNIQDQELAAAQQQAAQKESARETSAQQVTTSQPVEKTASEDTAGNSMSTPGMEQAGSKDVSKVEPVEAAPAPKAEEKAKPTEQKASVSSTAVPAAKPKPAAQSNQQAAPKVRKVANRPPMTSWWSQIPDLLFSSWMWMVGAGVGVLVLVLGLLMFLRRRQSIAEFEESILSGSALDSYSETTDTAGTSASDTSFLSDFGTAGMGTMQADEVDPLAEAEVYLAYGRDEQAEDVLKEAARRDPDRSEIKLKLLEIYRQRNDVKSFETIAEELYPAGDQGDPEVWSKVTAMGREVNPNNPLFQESGSPGAGGGAPGGAPAQEPAPAPGGMGLGLDNPAPAAAPSAAAPRDLGAADLDLDLDEAPPPAAPTRPTASAAASESDTLDFGNDFLEQSSRNVDPATQPFPAPDQQTDLDRELERLASEREAPAQRPAGNDAEPAPSREVSWDKAESDSSTLNFPSSDTSEIDFDLNLDESSIQQLSGADQGSSETSKSSPPGNGEGGLMEFESENIPPEETWAGPSTDAAPGGGDEAVSYAPTDDVQSSGAPQYNEAETKLDLARAYLDMGDKVGARSIIDEVMREGDPAQRDQAAELASQL